MHVSKQLLIKAKYISIIYPSTASADNCQSRGQKDKTQAEEGTESGKGEQGPQHMTTLHRRSFASKQIYQNTQASLMFLEGINIRIYNHRYITQRLSRTTGPTPRVLQVASPTYALRSSVSYTRNDAKAQGVDLRVY